jgi:hypothetical protein
MATSVPFVNTAYGAYHHHERPTEDEEFTHVGPGTPCGGMPVSGRTGNGPMRSGSVYLVTTTPR